MSPDEQLDQLFADYRAACPETEFGANFMPQIWQRIESRRSFWPAFEHLARVVLTMCAFACLLFALLNFESGRRSPASEQTYADALAAEQSSEAHFYAEAVHPASFQTDASQ